MRIELLSLGDLQPEPHPADYDWRFSDATASQIVDLLETMTGSVLCLGTPTVFQLLRRSGKDVVLIDRNPWYEKHFHPSSVHRLDLLVDSPPPGRLFDVILMDPPWYLDHMLWWFAWASQLLSKDGVIISTIFPVSARPSAERERQRLVRFMGSIGRMREIRESVTYKTPLFEQESDRTCGVCREPFWRSGELMIFEPNSPFFVGSRPQEHTWTRFVVGTQVIMMRERADTSPSRPRLVPIYEDGGTVLRSVSRRHRARRRIDIWTSRNRVFSIAGSTQKAKAMLIDLGTRTTPVALGLEDKNVQGSVTFQEFLSELEHA